MSAYEHLLGYVRMDSFLHRLDPRTKFFLFLITPAVLITTVTDPLIQTAYLVFIFLLFGLSKIPRGYLTRYSGIITKTIPFYVFFGLLFYRTTGERIIGYLIPFLNWIPLSWNLISFNWSAGIRFTIMLVCIWMLIFTTPVTEIASALVKWKLSPLISIAFSSALGVAPLVINEIRNIQDAQKARGFRITGRNPIRKIFAWLPLLVPIFWCSMKRVESLSLSMEARGFSYKAKQRTFWKELKFQRSDWVTLSFCISVIVISLIVGSFGLNYLDYKLTGSLLEKIF